MCFDDDSSPPVPPLSGAAVSHEDLVLEAADGNSFAAFAACSASMVLYFYRTTLSGERIIRVALLAALVTSGLTLFAQFALESPWAALVTLAVGGVVYATLRIRYGASAEPDLPDPSTNGHGKLNGHPG